MLIWLKGNYDKISQKFLLKYFEVRLCNFNIVEYRAKIERLSFHQTVDWLNKVNM